MPAKRHSNDRIEVRPGRVQANGARIRTLRLRMKLTQEALSRRCGLDTGTISRLESGAQVFPSSIHVVAKALGATYDELLLETQAAQPVPDPLLSSAELLISESPSTTVDKQELIRKIHLLMERIGAESPIASVNSSGTIDIILSIDCAMPDIIRLVSAFANKALDDLNVSSITLTDPAMFAFIGGSSGSGLVPTIQLPPLLEVLRSIVKLPTFAEGSVGLRTLRQFVSRTPATIEVSVPELRKAVLTRISETTC